MLCAGTGLAPMCQVIHTVLANELEETRLRLIYACRTYKDILAKLELDSWRQFWNFSSLFVLSQVSAINLFIFIYALLMLPAEMSAAEI